MGTLTAALIDLSDIVAQHLREGSRVRLDRWGLLKLEVESDKVDAPEEFLPAKHLRGVRLHFLPESEGGSPTLYQHLRLERAKP